jgi:hypothetical protein
MIKGHKVEDTLVATNKELIEALDGRIKTIEQELKIRPKPKSRLHAIIEWAGKNKIVAGISSLLIVFGSVYFGYWLEHKNDAWNSAVDSRIRQVLETAGGINETLSKVKETTNDTNATLKALTPFIHDVIQHQFESASKLSTKELQGRLPAVRELIEVAKNQKVKVQPEVTASLIKKLLGMQPEPLGFWGVGAALISYRSLSSTSWTPPSNLPDCIDLKPETGDFSLNIANKENAMKQRLAGYHDCRLTLDSTKDGEHLNSLLSGDTPIIFFKHCLIIYHGGPITFPVAWNNRVVASYSGEGGVAGRLSVFGSSLRFDDCIFDYSVNQAQPSTQVQTLTKLLLGQTGTTLEVPIASKQPS